MTVGRNDPCPCGSGKKYKKCCLLSAHSAQADDFSYRRYRDIESKLVARLFRHAAEVFGPASFKESWDKFHCGQDSDANNPENPITQIWGPYFLFSWEIDPAQTNCDMSLSGKTVTESFLGTQRARLSKEELEILDAANRCNFSFYEIVEVTPGQGFVLRNVLTEIECEVTERTGSQGAKRGSVIFGAFFEVNGCRQALGLSPYMLPPMSVQAVIKVRQILHKRLKTKKLTDAQVSKFDFMLREAYFILLEPLLNPQMPKLCNTDRDLLVPQTLHFEISSPEEAFSALNYLAAGFTSEDALRSDAKLKDGELYEVEIPWFKKQKFEGKEPASATLLGSVRIVGKKMRVEVNSNERAETVKRKIETALGSKTKFVIKVIESVEGNMGRGPSQGRPGPSGIPPEQLPPEALQAVKKAADAHWAKWFDDKIPALNGWTPKQAAKTKEGRELLFALLNTYEHRSGHADDVVTNLFQPDIQELRAKLGID